MVRPGRRSGPSTSCASSARSRSGRAFRARSRSDPPELGKVPLDRPHLGKPQRKLAGAAQIDELLVIRAPDGDLDAAKLIGLPFAQVIDGERAF